MNKKHYFEKTIEKSCSRCGGIWFVSIVREKTDKVCYECSYQLRLIKKREYNKKYRAENQEKFKKYREKRAENLKVYYKKYREKNIEKVRAWNRNHYNEKLKDNTQHKLSRSISVGIYKSIKYAPSSSKWEMALGYNIDKLQKHLEGLFVKGMNWDNYGEWHIDHIKPKSSFNYSTINDEEFKKCWDLKNLQPLWAEENMVKHAKF